MNDRQKTYSLVVTLYAILGVLIVALMLTACTPAPRVVHLAPPAPEPAILAVDADEDAFLAALAGGFVIHDLPNTPSGQANNLNALLVEAGYEVCTLLPEQRETALALATGYLGDPGVFQPEMPTLFVTAADIHLCSGGAR